jgi:integrase
LPDYSLKRPVINGRQSAVWYACWTEGRRSRRASTGETDRDAALGKLARWLAEETAAPPPQLTIAAFCDAYQKDREDDPRVKYPKAIRNSLNHIRRHLGPLTADLIGKATIARYIADRRREKVQPATISKELRFLRQALKFAEASKWIAKAPEFKLPGEGQPRDRFLTGDEFARLYFHTSPLHLRVFLALAISTGARGKHILALTWDRVDFDLGLVRYRPGESYNKRTAPIPINDNLRPVLEKAKLAAQSPFVVEWNGKRVLSVRKAYETAAKRAGLSDAHRHDLRRTAASWAAQRGIPIEQIAEMLGDDVETARKHYAQFSPDYLRAAVNALAGVRA